MEFWFALANVYRVLLATIEHPLPLCKVPQDGYCFVLTWWQASFLFTLQLFQATTFDLTICKAIAQSVWSLGFEPRQALHFANNQRRTTLLFKPGRNAWVRVLKWLQCSGCCRSWNTFLFELLPIAVTWNHFKWFPVERFDENTDIDEVQERVKEMYFHHLR